MLCVVFTAACGAKQGMDEAETAPSDSLNIVYSTGFKVYYYDDYKQVVVCDPWDPGRVLGNYYLVDTDEQDVPQGGVKVVVPLQRLVSMSVTHYEFLALLGELESVVGVCRAELAYNETIRQRHATGLVADVGDAFAVDAERIFEIEPSAVMASGELGVSSKFQRLAEAGIPVLFNNEWMEPSPLARAEWLKFFAAFYNKEEAADSLFSALSLRYEGLLARVDSARSTPSVMSGASFRGVWYAPGGGSFMARLFADAGASYAYSDVLSSGSLPVTMERALIDFAGADYWLNCPYVTYAELLAADAHHARFEAVEKRRVYHFNKRMLDSGANDFWESATAHPDLLLADVVSIVHPDLLAGYVPTYAAPLE